MPVNEASTVGTKSSTDISAKMQSSADTETNADMLMPSNK